jgi:hypothetical protein
MSRIARFLLVTVFLGITTAASGAELTLQKSSVGGVTVSVAPYRAATGWEFKVVLDTHSQDLSDDLLGTAMLVDSTGTTYKPVAWDGAGPGGHHREGVLRFPAVSPEARALELQITRPNEAKPRTFRWQLP